MNEFLRCTCKYEYKYISMNIIGKCGKTVTISILNLISMTGSMSG